MQDSQLDLSDIPESIGLLMACRRKRITLGHIDGFLMRWKALPIDAAGQTPPEVLELPAFAQSHSLTNYDAARLALCESMSRPNALQSPVVRPEPEENLNCLIIVIVPNYIYT